MVLQGPRMSQVLERLVLQVQLLAASVRDGCTDAYMGGTSRAGKGMESRGGLGEEKPQAV